MNAPKLWKHKLPPPPVELLDPLYREWYRVIGVKSLSIRELGAARRSDAKLKAAIDAFGMTGLSFASMLRRAEKVHVPGWRLLRDRERGAHRWRYTVTRTAEKVTRPKPRLNQPKRVPKPPKPAPPVYLSPVDVELSQAAVAFRASGNAGPVETPDPAELDIARQTAREGWRRDMLDPRPAPVPTVAPAEMHDPAPLEIWAGPFDTREAAEAAALIVRKTVASKNARASAEVVALDGFWFAISNGAASFDAIDANRAVAGCRAVGVRARRGRFGHVPTLEEGRQFRADQSRASGPGFGSRNPERGGHFVDDALLPPGHPGRAHLDANRPARKPYDPRD